jgi:hypothetical protein
MHGFSISHFRVGWFILLLAFGPLAEAQITHNQEDIIQKILGEDRDSPDRANKLIHMPSLHGEIIYQYTSPMDSSLSKEKIYRAAMNWYYKTFPYGHNMLIQNDLREGKILARGEYQFSYSTLMEDLKMKIQYMMNFSIRYGKYQFQIYQIEPQDQVLDENEYGKTYSHFEPRSLSLMYQQYREQTDPPYYMRQKIEGIHGYFQNLIQSFSKTMHSWTHTSNPKGF